MDGRRQLGEFLRTRRSQLLPEDVGVVDYGDRRRVPGLRREELALLAGVSPSYYSRLEQGQSSNASPEVLDAIAAALRLDDAERRHLHALAAAPRRSPAGRRAVPERVTPSVLQVVAALAEVPVVVLGRRSDVLAWNRAGNALFAGHLDGTRPNAGHLDGTRPNAGHLDGIRPNAGHLDGILPNMARLVFLDAHTRELYEDWPAKARAVVGGLRATSGQYPDDPALAVLVGELTLKSPEFASMWAAHRVKGADVAVHVMRHPLVGRMTVTQQILHAEHGQQLVVATTEEGSPSRAAMTLLVHSVTV